jgi:hypothetical protein
MKSFFQSLNNKTMKKQRTIYHLIVDKSGSMTGCMGATINGYNEQLNRILSMQKEFPEQEILMGFTLFNDTINLKAVAENLNNATRLNTENYVPSGCTALYDAIGKTALHLEEMAARNSDIPTTFVVVVLTDGYENSSNFFNLHQIRHLISRLESTGRWTFSFIGATLDAVEVAEQMAFKSNNSYSFDKSEMESAVWNKLSDSMHHYFNKKNNGRTDLSVLFDKES